MSNVTGDLEGCLFNQNSRETKVTLPKHGHQAVRRRQRQTLSCLPCRQLKVRCDRKMPCSHCVWSERAASCVYASFPGKLSDSKSSRRAARSESCGQTVSSDSGGSRRESSGTSTLHSSLAPKPLLLPRVRVQDCVPFPTRANTSESPRTPQENEYRDRKGYYYHHTAWKSKFRGPTHWATVLREFENTLPEKFRASKVVLWRFEQLEKNKGFCCTLQSPNYPFGLGNNCETLTRGKILSYIPNRSTAELLVQTYLDTVEKTHRLLHVPTFKDELSRFWANPAMVEDDWLAQLFMILALGYQGSKNKLFRQTLKDVNQSMLDEFFIGAEACLKNTSFLCIPNVTTIRTLCIIVIAKRAVACSCHELDACGPLMATIVRLSMSIGLHCDPQDDGTISPFDKEIRRRLWTTIAYMELQQSMTTGMPLLLRYSDFDTLPPTNINDADISPSSYQAIPARRLEEQTDSSFQIMLARSFPIAFDIVCLANSPSGALEYDQVLQYNAEIKSLLYETMQMYNSATSGDNHKWVHLQRFMLDTFFRRILLALHLPYAQDPDAQILYPISYWSSLECSLAVLVQQRHMCEDPSSPHTLLWFAELFKYDFYIAALIVCVQLHRKDAPRLDEIQKTDHTGIQMPPSRTIIQTLQFCREIWGRDICRSHCHFITHLTLGKLINTLECKSLGLEPEQQTVRSMQQSINALERCACGNCGSGPGTVRDIFLNQHPPATMDGVV